MNTQEFIDLFVEELEIEDVEVKEDTVLSSLEEWDSMGTMIVIGLVANNFQVKLTSQDLQSLTTVKSLIDKIGNNNFTN